MLSDHVVCCQPRPLFFFFSFRWSSQLGATEKYLLVLASPWPKNAVAVLASIGQSDNCWWPISWITDLLLLVSLLQHPSAIPTKRIATPFSIFVRETELIIIIIIIINTMAHLQQTMLEDCEWSILPLGLIFFNIQACPGLDVVCVLRCQTLSPFFFSFRWSFQLGAKGKYLLISPRVWPINAIATLASIG